MYKQKLLENIDKIPPKKNTNFDVISNINSSKNNNKFTQNNDFKIKHKYKPMSKFWEKIVKKHYKSLMPPLTTEEYKIMKSKMSKDLDVPKELEEYLLTVSRELSINSHNMDLFEEFKNKWTNDPTHYGYGRIYIGINLKEQHTWSGAMYLYIKKDCLFGTVWIDDDYSGGTVEKEELMLFAPNFKDFFVRFFMEDPKKYICKNKDMYIEDYIKMKNL